MKSTMTQVMEQQERVMQLLDKISADIERILQNMKKATA